MSRRLDHEHWNSPRPIRRLLKAPRGANEHGVQPVSMMESAPGPEVVQDGARFLYFGGTGYLGLASHPEGRTAHFGFQVGDAAEMRRIHEGLRSRGILLPYFKAYSGVPSDGLLRVAVFANHTFDQIDRLVSEFRSLL